MTTQRSVRMAEGFELQLAGPLSKTGFKNVYLKKMWQNSDRPYSVEDDNRFQLGRFATAVEAAVEYAKYKAGESERDRIARESVVDIMTDNGKEGIERRWLVKQQSQSSDGIVHTTSDTWLPQYLVPPPLLERYKIQAAIRHNETIEPALTAQGGSSVLSETGVQPCKFDASTAVACADFLRNHWQEDGACMLGAIKAFGYSTYSKVLGEHDSNLQARTTLLITNSMLELARLHLAGFERLELQVAAWLEQRFNTRVELYYAHVLRQSPATINSTGFDVHQDTEEYDFISYTVVVKLTADEAEEASSEMRVLGAKQHFQYGAEAGTAGCFRASLHHASVKPTSNREHLKIAFFFRAQEGNRRSRSKRLRQDAAND